MGGWKKQKEKTEMMCDKDVLGLLRQVLSHKLECVIIGSISCALAPRLTA